MSQYIIRRLLLMIPTLFVISVISFLMMHFAPGDPIAMYMNPQKRSMSPEDIQALRHKLGLDRPAYVQYYRWLTNTLQGDWGYSFKSKAPVLQEILSRLPNTLLLGGAAIFLTILLAIPIGVISAVKRYTLIDYLTTIAAFIGISMPGFWFALILLDVFANRLGWLPSVGMQSLGQEFAGWDKVSDVLKHLVLPMLAMSVVEMAYWARYQRSSLLEVMNQDYIRTARSKGLRERLVIFRHGFRNALIPMVTLLGLTIPDLVSGSYIIESVFGWPGMGRLGVNSLLYRDYPIVMGVTMLSALLVVGGNLLADILYALIDPRIHQT
jgi:peptide/nickel transport system permease protein